MNFNQDIQSLENVCKRTEVSTVPFHRCRLVDAIYVIKYTKIVAEGEIKLTIANSNIYHILPSSKLRSEAREYRMTATMVHGP